MAPLGAILAPLWRQRGATWRQVAIKWRQMAPKNGECGLPPEWRHFSARMAPFWRKNGATPRHVAPEWRIQNSPFAKKWRDVAGPPRGDVHRLPKLCTHRHVAPFWRHVAPRGAKMAPFGENSGIFPKQTVRHVAPRGARMAPEWRNKPFATWRHSGAICRVAPFWRQNGA